MAIDIALDTPLSKALQGAVQSKLAEAGWSTESVEDSALAEYIILLLVNKKSQNEVSADIVDMVESCDPGQANEFARWLFEQVNLINQQINSSQTQQYSAKPAEDVEVSADIPHTSDAADQHGDMNIDETDADAVTSSVPTGPKSMSMRTGNNRTRGQRIIGQVNQAMNRSHDQILHRVKGASGGSRINTHNRQPPRGPKGMQRNSTPQRAGMDGMGMLMPDMSNNGMGNMSPQQQMQLLALYEEQARMMAQILSPQQQQMFPMQMGFGQNGLNQQPSPHQGKSLFERVDTQGVRNNQQHHHVGLLTAERLDPSSSMEVESSSQQNPKADPSSTVCKFNLSCTRPDCNYAHQSPAAPPDVTLDMTDTCSFGIACKNRKCVGKHPSPAGRGSHLAEVDCKYFPNCTNPSCPYKHPSMPPCRNGADCTVSGCKFSHSKVVCKYDPCLNPSCPFKHAEGQKRGVFEDKVWINTDDDDTKPAHLSERKFVQDKDAEEELILPGQGDTDSVQPATESVAV